MRRKSWKLPPPALLPEGIQFIKLTIQFKSLDRPGVR